MSDVSHHLPSSVTVGPYRYSIQVDRARLADLNRRQDGSHGHQVGETDHVTLEITMDPHLPLDLLKETLLHEVIHCIWSTVNLRQRKLNEEDVIGSLVPTLLDTLRRNPTLVEYLLKP